MPYGEQSKTASRNRPNIANNFIDCVLNGFSAGLSGALFELIDLVLRRPPAAGDHRWSRSVDEALRTPSGHGPFKPQIHHGVSEEFAVLVATGFQ